MEYDVGNCSHELERTLNDLDSKEIAAKFNFSQDYLLDNDISYFTFEAHILRQNL